MRLSTTILALLVALAAPIAQDAVRIMPLGDSITDNGGGIYSYRSYLYKRLVNEGYAVDFVGSMRGRGELDYDADHEGHSGWTADEVLGSLPVWSRSYTPHIVLCHLGTNDMCGAYAGNLDLVVSRTITDLRGIIDTLRNVDSTVVILLAQIIPSRDDVLQRYFQRLNDSIPNLVAQSNTQQSPVVLVDHWTGFDPVADLVDGLHPNASGAQKMADVWYAALVPYLAQYHTVTQPQVSARVTPRTQPAWTLRVVGGRAAVARSAGRITFDVRGRRALVDPQK